MMWRKSTHCGRENKPFFGTKEKARKLRVGPRSEPPSPVQGTVASYFLLLLLIDLQVLM